MDTLNAQYSNQRLHQNQQIVSVIVVSYNSASTILETLLSIKEQTYDRIELIVADDASIDATCSIASEWLSANSSRFVSSRLVRSIKNSGIAANCNQGVFASTGSWIKLIAADDMLLPECIAKNIAFAGASDGAVSVVQSCSLYYSEVFKESSFLYERRVETEPISLKLHSRYQLHILRWAPSINAPTVFLRRSVLEKVGYFSEEIREFEDWPLWLKISRSGIVIHTLAETTVKYRVNSQSVSNSGRNNCIFSPIYRKLYRFSRTHIWQELGLFDKVAKRYEVAVYYFLERMALNRKNTLCKTLFVALLFPVRFHILARTTIARINICHQ